MAGQHKYVMPNLAIEDPPHSLFGAVQGDIQLSDWSGELPIRSIAFWVLHVDIFALTEFTIKEG
ncbi:hypothetical protein PISMIDRAFT_7222 [Pisolithus microcarpus 441]|uniref:Unplaced genomic scaffold scaffold_7, whole genome shotgun sequence n=1 Tax=Pisolithus microcarpus 441 TaxID=765257 RepID=A0A0D0A2T1_9AGAM|nr:hypothetical protein PISMIDRAFT_7222 [Pisolithus microcarpus 441]